LFEDQAFSVRDPDGKVVVFGLAPQLAAEAEERPRLHGPLQHLTLATQDPATLEAFYFGKLGFAVSDRVRNDKDEVKLPRFDGHGNSNEKRGFRWNKKEAHYL
jgi:catechol 2,3-dioxygenase